VGEISVSATRNVLNPNSTTFEERAKQLEEQDRLEAEARKRAKNSPFSRWTQFNNEHTKELMWLAIKAPKAHAILYFLVDQMDEYNAVMCSYKVLQEVLETSKATIQRNIQILKDKGYIAVLKSGTSNVYAINDSVYWKSWGNKKQYSKFPANVVLAMSEQDDDYQISFAEIGAERHKEVKLKED
jgi:predicted transcriptional regulator